MDLLQSDKYRQQLQADVKVRSIGERILLVYIFFLPFLSAFALTPIFSIPFLISILLFGWMFLSVLIQQRLPKGFFGLDIFFVCWILLIVLISYLFNGRGSDKSLNHAIAYTSTFLLFYIPVKFILFNSLYPQLLFRQALKVLTITVLISAVYAISEFIFNNFLGIDLNNYIYRPPEGVRMFDATVLALFARSRGFAVESGHFTFMMEMFSPLVVFYLYFSGYCKWNRVFKLFSVLAIILSFIVAFSTASFVIVPIAIALSAVLYLKSILRFVQSHFIKITFALAAIAFVLIILNSFVPVFELIIQSVKGKLGGGGYDYRRNNIDFFFTSFSNFPVAAKLIGIGPAGTLLLGFGTSHAILNLYFSLAFEIGILGLFCVLLLILYCLLHITRLNPPLGFWVTISVLAGLMHYYFIANYYYPWFWFLLVFIVYCSKKRVLQ